MFTGCSTKKSSSDIWGGGKVKDDQKITAYSGVWKSACIPHTWGAYRTVEMNIQSANLTYKETSYQDENCTQPTNKDTVDLKGVMVNKGKTKSGAWIVEFRIPIGNGYTWRNFLLQKQKGALKISDFYGSFTKLEDVKLDITLNTKSKEQEVEKPAPEEPAALVLLGGRYVQADDDYFCDQIISTMDSGGRTLQIWADLIGTGCAGRLIFICEDGLCEGQDGTLKILSLNSYEFTNKEGRKGVFGR